MWEMWALVLIASIIRVPSHVTFHQVGSPIHLSKFSQCVVFHSVWMRCSNPPKPGFIHWGFLNGRTQISMQSIKAYPKELDVWLNFEINILDELGILWNGDGLGRNWVQGLYCSGERFHSDYQAQKKTIINLLAKQLKLSEIQINLINRVASAWVILASLTTGATNTQYLI